MAVLTPQELLTKVTEFIGDDFTAENVSFVEDVSDTINDLEKKASVDVESIKKEYDDKLNGMRRMYVERFTRIPAVNNPNTPEAAQLGGSEPQADVTVDDLFK